MRQKLEGQEACTSLPGVIAPEAEPNHIAEAHLRARPDSGTLSAC